MKADEIRQAIEQCDSIYIGVQLLVDGDPHALKWRDKSKAMRRKISMAVKTTLRDNPGAEFNATMSQVGPDRILVIGMQGIAHDGRRNIRPNWYEGRREARRGLRPKPSRRALAP